MCVYIGQYRVERMRCPLCTDVEQYYEDMCFPVLQNLAKRQEFRDAIYRYKLIPNILSTIPQLMKNLVLIAGACQVFCITMYHQATFIEERFAVQFLRSRGPEFCMKASRLCDENTKLTTEVCMSCFLPIVCIAEIDMGKTWLETNCVKVSPFVDKYRPKVNTLTYEDEGIKIRSKILWKRFTDFFEKIEAKQRERNLKELLEEEERNTAKRIKKREKRKQKRQRQNETKAEDNRLNSSDDEKKSGVDDLSQHSETSDTVCDVIITSSNYSIPTPTLDKSSKRANTKAQKARNKFDSTNQDSNVLVSTDDADGALRPQSPTGGVAEKREFVESMLIGDQWVTVQGKKCKKNVEMDASQNCKTKRGRNKKNKNSTKACTIDTQVTDAQAPTPWTKAVAEKPTAHQPQQQPQQQKQITTSEKNGSNFDNKYYDDEFPSLLNNEGIVSYSAVVNRSSRTRINSDTWDVKSDDNDRSSCTGSYSDKCGSESGISRASPTSNTQDNVGFSSQGEVDDYASSNDQETANCGVIFGSESLQNLLKSENRIADLRASNMAAPPISIKELGHSQFLNDVAAGNMCERGVGNAHPLPNPIDSLNESSLTPIDMCNIAYDDAFPTIHHMTSTATEVRQTDTQKPGQNQRMSRLPGNNRTLPSSTCNQPDLMSGRQDEIPTSCLDPPPGIQQTGAGVAGLDTNAMTISQMQLQMNLMNSILQEQSRQLQLNQQLAACGQVGSSSLDHLRANTNSTCIANQSMLRMPTTNQQISVAKNNVPLLQKNYKQQDSKSEKINLDADFVSLNCLSPIQGNPSGAESEFLQYWASNLPRESSTAPTSAIPREIPFNPQATHPLGGSSDINNVLLTSSKPMGKTPRPGVMKGTPNVIEASYSHGSPQTGTHGAHESHLCPSLDIGQSLLKNTGHLVDNPDEIKAADVLFPSDLRNPTEGELPAVQEPLVFPGFHDDVLPSKEQKKETMPSLVDRIRLAQLQSYYESFADNSLVKNTAYFHDFYYYASCLGLDYSTIFKYAGDRSLLDEKRNPSKCNFSTDKYGFVESCRPCVTERVSSVNVPCASRSTGTSLICPADQSVEYGCFNTWRPAGTMDDDRHPSSSQTKQYTTTNTNPLADTTDNSMWYRPSDVAAQCSLVNTTQLPGIEENVCSSVQTDAQPDTWDTRRPSPEAGIKEPRGVVGDRMCTAGSSYRDTQSAYTTKEVIFNGAERFSAGGLSFMADNQVMAENVTCDVRNGSKTVSNSTRHNDALPDLATRYMPQLCDEMFKGTEKGSPDHKTGEMIITPKIKKADTDTCQTSWEPRSRRWKDKLRELKGLAENKRTQIGDIIIPKELDNKFMVTNT